MKQQQKPDTSEANTTGIRHWMALILLIIVILAIYSNIYNYPFVLDDEKVICDTPKNRNPANYLSWETLYYSRNIVNLTFALNYMLGRQNPTGFHLVNVVIHIITCSLVYFLALAFSPWFVPGSCFSRRSYALLAACIFAAHPVQTQAITYTVQRYTSMAAMFYLAAILFYMHARGLYPGETGGDLKTGKQVAKQRVQPGRILLFVLFVLSGALAALCKLNAASLPVAVLLVEFVFSRRDWKHWKVKMPWLGLLFLICFIFLLSVTGIIGRGHTAGSLSESIANRTAENFGLSRWHYLYTQFNVLVIYIRLLFLPVNQNFDYLYPFKDGFTDGMTPLAFLFLTGLVLLAFKAVRKHPVITFATGWFFVTLSVESSIFPISDAIFEHRLYLSMFGFAVLVPYLAGLAAVRFKMKPYLIAGLVILLVLTLGTAAWLRNSVYRSKESLWTDVMEKSPHNFRAYNALGLLLAKEGRYEEAIDRYKKSLEIYPPYSKAYVNLGVAYNNLNLFSKATEAYMKAIELDPKHPEAHNNLGFILLEAGRTVKAIKHLKKAAELRHGYVKALTNLAKAYTSLSEHDQAIASYEKILALDPGNTTTMNTLANTCLKAQQIDKAIDLYQGAIRQDPSFGEAYTNLGAALFSKGDMPKAIETLRRAVELDNSNSKAYHNLASALFSTGRIDESVSMYRKAIEFNPGYSEAHNNLASVLLAAGRKDEAIAAYTEAARLLPGDARALNKLGTTCYQKNLKHTAQEFYRQATAVDPTYAEAFFNLGVACNDLKDLAGAIEHYHRAITINPGYAQAHNNLAVAYYHGGQFSQAIKHCDIAVKLGVTVHPTLLKLLKPYRIQEKLKDAVMTGESGAGDR